MYSILPKHGQFKGNQCELIHVKSPTLDDGDENTIQLRNSYYTGFSLQSYSIKYNKTKCELRYSLMNPKYMQDKVDELHKSIITDSWKYTDKKMTHVDAIYIDHDDLSIRIDKFGLSITSIQNHKGFVFKNKIVN
jgi:hypothetical protein